MGNCRRKDPESAMDTFYIKMFLEFHRFAVDMRWAPPLADNLHVVSAECVDEHVTLDESRQHINAHESCR